LAALKLGPEGIKKTESLIYNQNQSIDTPGEMLLLPKFFNALILNSTRAAVVLMVMDGRRPTWLPARLCLTLKAPVVGVVTKIDSADDASINKAEKALGVAGVKQVFKISAITGSGLDELKDWLSRMPLKN
jgi:ethanolamine utilization protein EutP